MNSQQQHNTSTTRFQFGGGGRSSNRLFFRPPSPGGSRSGLPTYVYVAAGGTTLLCGYCYYAFLDEVPLTHRRRWIATSPEWEQRMGDQEYRLLLRTFAQQRTILPPTHRAAVTVNRVGSHLAEASQQFAQQHNRRVASSSSSSSSNNNNNNKPYTYTVVRSDMANAFVLPGNHVFVMTGLFRYVRDEDDLAAVLGHEMAHNIARHAGEKISSSLVITLLAPLFLLLDPSGFLLQLAVPAAKLLRELPHSRTQEAEADQIGLHLAAAACYDPRAAKRVFGAMQQHDSAAPPEFLSTHPSHESRIANMDQWMPDALQTLQNNHDRCRQIRHEMQVARQAAALDAALREQRQQK